MNRCCRYIHWCFENTGFEPGCTKCRCFKHVLYHMIRSLPRQDQIPCVDLGIELKKRTSNYIIVHFTMPVIYFVVYALSLVPPFVIPNSTNMSENRICHIGPDGGTSS